MLGVTQLRRMERLAIGPSAATGRSVPVGSTATIELDQAVAAIEASVELRGGAGRATTGCGPGRVGAIRMAAVDA